MAKVAPRITDFHPICSADGDGWPADPPPAPLARACRWHRAQGADVKLQGGAAEKHDMRAAAVSALLALLVLPMACKAPGKGVKVLAPLDTPEPSGVMECGPQPPPRMVARLVRREHPGRAARDFRFSKLERWRVVTGRESTWGWRVVVGIDAVPKLGQDESTRGAYLIRREGLGFVIAATGESQQEGDGFVWSVRDLDHGHDEARRLELERRRQELARARTAPTPADLMSADFGSAPLRYRKTIKDYLRDVHEVVPESANVKLGHPVKTWARRVGSPDTVFGWRVTATVTDKIDVLGEAAKRYDFMFRNGKVLSTTRLGKGFRLTGTEPSPQDDPANPAK